jgi:class 3 adenylate cyclase
MWERGEWDMVESDRVLATVLFTDIVGSTAKLAELGDRRWRDLLAEHHRRVRRQLARFRGRELDTTGDGFSPPSMVQHVRSAARTQSSRR